MRYYLLMVVSIAVLVLFCSCRRCFIAKRDVAVVQGFELERYLGKWYEIARLENPFEKNCERVTAEYSVKGNSVGVINTCFVNGRKKVAKGIARFANRNDEGALCVSFFPFCYGQYNIVILDKDYKYAVVRGGSDDYLWILSRTPTIASALETELLDEIKGFGLDVSKLHYTKQVRR